MDGWKAPPKSSWNCQTPMSNTSVFSDMAIDLGAMLDAVNANQLLARIIPIQNAIIAHTKLAQTSQISRHPNQPPMHHDGGIFGELLNLAFDACRDGGVQFSELCVSFAAYFDPVGHGSWRGFQTLNLPARSSRRAARSSAMIFGFCAVSQSCNSSSVSTEDSTGVGISTVSIFMRKPYHVSLRV